MKRHCSGCGGTAPLPCWLGGHVPPVPPGSYAYDSTVNFAFSHSDDHVTFSHSGFGTAGETYSLTCKAILVNPGIFPTGAPTPTFQWFFGPNGNGSLPSGLITPATTSRIATDHTKIIYNRTLQLSPLSQSHTGMYTCRIGAGRLVNSDVVAVNGSFCNNENLTCIKFNI